jgi:hypothetical protein
VGSVDSLLIAAEDSGSPSGGWVSPGYSYLVDNTANKTSLSNRDDTSATDEEFSFGEISIPGITLNSLNIYGYFSTKFEKVYSVPALQAGATVNVNEPAEFAYPFFNVLMQHQLHSKFKAFINLNGSGAGTMTVQNFWGEYAAADFFNIRIGKIYRKFGLYNEILDAVPTYYGIEPPELFDADHLLISRTTACMVYGGFKFGPGTINYSVSTDNGEGDPVAGTTPVGYDFNYKLGGGDYTLGISGYASGGKTTSDVELGDGSPKSGVLPWMASDKFSVLGGYFESKIRGLTLQAEYWRASHNAERDPDLVVTMINGANPNAAQRARFLKNPTGSVETANVKTIVAYEVETWYFRGGYAFESNIGEIAPYVQWDYYSNPEVIAKKKFGGDAEAGLADDNRFNKATIGLVYRPVPQVALKLDASSHQLQFNGKTESYIDLRLDVSFLFGQLF